MRIGSTTPIGPEARFCHCVVNQQRDGPNALFNRGDNLRRALWIDRIGWDSQHLICRGAELHRSFVEFGCRSTRNGDVCASAEQRLSKGST
jgi:hypothetical protein